MNFAPSPLGFVIDALAARRLTRLVVEDTITEPLREKVFERFGSPHSGSNKISLSYAVTCDHCTGIYMSALTTAAHVLAPRASAPVRYALALAALISIHSEISAKTEDDTPEAGNFTPSF